MYILILSFDVKWQILQESRDKFPCTDMYKETLFSQPSCLTCYLVNWKAVHPVITGWCIVMLLLCLALTARTLASLHLGVAQGQGMVPGQVFHICSNSVQIYQSWQGLTGQDILLLLYLPTPCITGNKYFINENVHVHVSTWWNNQWID